MINKVFLLGNVGSDPEIRYMPDGNAVANFSLATSEHYKDKQSGERKEITEWHRVTLFGKVAEVAGEFVKKGDKLHLEGKIKTRKYTDREGVEKSITEIHCHDMKMLGSPNRQGGGRGGYGSDDEGGGYQRQERRPAPSRAPAPAPRPSSNFDDMDDDVPF